MLLVCCNRIMVGPIRRGMLSGVCGQGSSRRAGPYVRPVEHPSLPASMSGLRSQLEADGKLEELEDGMRMVAEARARFAGGQPPWV